MLALPSLQTESRYAGSSPQRSGCPCSDFDIHRGVWRRWRERWGSLLSPTPDFSMELSSDAISVAQGATSTPVNVSIAGQYGFASDVSISFSGLPAGVTSNAASAFPVTTAQSVSVLFRAGPNASTGQFTLTVQGTSGTLSHSKSLALSIQVAALTNLAGDCVC